ncbi:MAG: hypothetical protein ACE5JM_04230 [Armatimonadota bacterium]
MRDAGNGRRNGRAGATASAQQDQARAKVWAEHRREKQAAELTEEAKEAERDRLLSEEGYGRHHIRAPRTVARRRAREVTMSQLQAPGYSGTRHLLRTMAESMRLLDAEEHTGVAEWSLRRDVVHAIRAETALKPLEREALLDRIRGESLRDSAQRLGVSHEEVRRRLAAALRKYYARRLPRLEAASAAAACFFEDASRQSYREPNCCGQSPLCLDDAESKPCAWHEHERPRGANDDDVRPGDLNYCPLAELPGWLWSRR